jgi:hypothetical protein
LAAGISGATQGEPRGSDTLQANRILHHHPISGSDDVVPNLFEELGFELQEKMTAALVAAAILAADQKKRGFGNGNLEAVLEMVRGMWPSWSAKPASFWVTFSNSQKTRTRDPTHHLLWTIFHRVPDPRGQSLLGTW